MKAILFTLLTLLAGSAAFADAQDEARIKADFDNAEKKFAEACQQMIFMQPGLPDMLNALNVFDVEERISACALHPKIGLKPRTAFYLHGYRAVLRGHEFTYTLIDFSGDNAKSQDCVATSHYEHPAGGSWDAQMEVFDISCTPTKK